jgi:hypothetical protein
MEDLIWVGVGLTFFGLTGMLVMLCDRLSGGKDGVQS